MNFVWKGTGTGISKCGRPECKNFNRSKYYDCNAEIFRIRIWPNFLDTTFLNLAVSVVDPNTLYLVPDPEFWPNLDPDPRVMLYPVRIRNMDTDPEKLLKTDPIWIQIHNTAWNASIITLRYNSLWTYRYLVEDHYVLKWIKT